jgi:hypothetical protein
MDHDGIRLITSYADEMGISDTFVLHRMRSGSMSLACTVCARESGSRLVLERAHNVSVSAKAVAAFRSRRNARGCVNFFEVVFRPAPFRGRPGAKVSHAESD